MLGTTLKSGKPTTWAGDICRQTRRGGAGWGGQPGVKNQEVPIWPQAVATNMKLDHRQGAPRDGLRRICVRARCLCRGGGR